MFKIFQLRKCFIFLENLTFLWWSWLIEFESGVLSYFLRIPLNAYIYETICVTVSVFSVNSLLFSSKEQSLSIISSSNGGLDY